MNRNSLEIKLYKQAQLNRRWLPVFIRCQGVSMLSYLQFTPQGIGVFLNPSTSNKERWYLLKTFWQKKQKTISK